LEPLFHLALALLNAGAFWLAAVIVAAIALAILGPVRLSPSIGGSSGRRAVMSREIPILDRFEAGRFRGILPRPHSDVRSFKFLNYAALLQKGAPEAPRAKSKSECTSILMKFLETLAAVRPLSLFLVAVIILSAGIAVRIAGPISIHIPHVEIPAIEIHAGSAPVVAEPSKKEAPSRPLHKRPTQRHLKTWTSITPNSSREPAVSCSQLPHRQ